MKLRSEILSARIRAGTVALWWLGTSELKHAKIYVYPEKS
jgi:hypothetical protein